MGVYGDLPQFRNTERLVVYFIILLGIVSLFGDVTYEGARSVAGPYLATLGASASVVGLVAGIGEFVGYALRLASGHLADRTKAYWLLTFVGYGLLLAIPLLAYLGMAILRRPAEIQFEITRQVAPEEVTQGHPQEARLVIEKPFCSDLDSARALNQSLLTILDESQIYRRFDWTGCAQFNRHRLTQEFIGQRTYLVRHGG